MPVLKNDRGTAYAQAVIAESGVYQIRNTVNGKRYIGSAVDFQIRWFKHKKLLKQNKHHSIHLQRAWNIYGESKFKFEILLLCKSKKLLIYEQKFIDKKLPEYNICPIAGSTLGLKMSDKARLNISKGKMGHKVSLETRTRLSIANKGHGFSDESRAKMSIAQSKRIHPPEVKAKISAASRGENNGNAKLTWFDVKRMRRLYFIESYRYSQIARSFEVNWSTAKRAITGESWKA